MPPRVTASAWECHLCQTGYMGLESHPACIECGHQWRDCPYCRFIAVAERGGGYAIPFTQVIPDSKEKSPIGTEFSQRQDHIREVLDENPEKGTVSSLGSSNPVHSRIRDEIRGLFSGAHASKQSISIVIRWQIEDFLREELDDHTGLSDLFTITGDAKDAYACTSLEYANQTWPRLERALLVTVQRLCRNQDQLKHTLKYPGLHGSNITDDHDLVINFERLEARSSDVKDFSTRSNSEGFFRVTVSGTEADIIDVAQQLAWMTATFRVASDQQLMCSGTVFRPIEASHTFLLELAPLRNPSKALWYRSCWHSLVEGSVIAEGFRIPERSLGCNGLEISFDLMAYLARVRCPLMYKNGIVLKGDSHILVPTAIEENFIQWHRIPTNGLDRTDLGMISKTCRDVVETTSLDTLKTPSRGFLGYCRRVYVHLGTKDFHGARISTSGAASEKSHVQISTSVAPQLGFNYFAQLNVGFKVKFSKKLRGRTMGNSLSYSLELERARQQPLIFCDVATKRSWLVPELSVVLQIAQSVVSSRADIDEEALKGVPYAKVASDGGLEALRAIRKGESLLLRPGGEYSPSEPFMEIIKYVMDALGSRRAQNFDKSCENDITLRRSPILYGWELKDIVDLCHVWDRRQVPIDPLSSGTWSEDIAHSPDILTLFCKDLPEPIGPAEDAEVCSNWVPLPEGKHYLAASMRCLSKVKLPAKLEKEGLRNRNRLQHLKEHRKFEPCYPNPSTRLGCNRLQDLRAFKATFDPSDDLYEDGAVLLGNPFPYVSTVPCQRFKTPKSNAVEAETAISARLAQGKSERSILCVPWTPSKGNDIAKSAPLNVDSDQALQSDTSSTDLRGELVPELWSLNSIKTRANPQDGEIAASHRPAHTTIQPDGASPGSREPPHDIEMMPEAPMIEPSDSKLPQMHIDLKRKSNDSQHPLSRLHCEVQLGPLGYEPPGS